MALAATALKVPAAHSERALPLPVNPASARQSVKASLPVLVPVLELDGQCVHPAGDSECCLYVPGAQGTTLAPFPLWPAFAKQKSIVVVAASLQVLEGQGVHSNADRVDAFHVPATHARTDVPLPVNPASAKQSVT